MIEIPVAFYRIVALTECSYVKRARLIDLAESGLSIVCESKDPEETWRVEVGDRCLTIRKDGVRFL